MKNKFLLTATLVATMTLAAPMVASAAEAGDGSWHNNAQGWWWQYSDNTYVTNDFVEVNGATYYFKADGYMATGWQKIEQKSEYSDWTWSNWYYFESNGAMVKDSWKQINGKWYFFDGTGAMVRNGIYTIDDKEQVFAPSGQWVSGWTWDSYTNDYGDEMSGWYYANTDGTPYDYDANDDRLGGWLQSGSKWYYIYSDGTMAYDTMVTVKDVKYRLNSSGEMVAGWYQYGNTEGDWFFSNYDGSVVDGWYAYNGSWYYFDDGIMRTSTWVYSEAEDSDVKYYLGRDGKMVTGWYNTSAEGATYSSTSWIYTNPDGSDCTGWVDSNGKWYYIVDGEMVSNGSCRMQVKVKNYKKADGTIDYKAYWQALNAQPTYIFDATGAMVTGWYQVVSKQGGQITYNEWYYADADGVGHDGWLDYNGAWYYIERGHMLTNQYTPDGYWVGADGVWR